ncbi:g10962 [Coccomyxa elongata]
MSCSRVSPVTTRCFVGFVITAFQFIKIESLHTAERATKEGLIIRDVEGYRYTENLDDRAIASGKYVDASQTISNCGQLHIKTNGKYTDKEQMFAAGFFEGFTTAERIHDYWSNTYTYFVEGMNASLPEPLAWLKRQEEWARREVSEHQESSYWQMLGLLFEQFDGLVAGYNARHHLEPDRIPALSRLDFVFVNGNGELYDLLEAKSPHLHAVAPDRMSAVELFHDLALKGRCSALITVTPDFSDLFMGHSTWDSYSQMMKLFKHYSFQLHLPGVAAQQMSFSSYPGELFSDDDLYMMDSKMVVLSTTNKMFNTSLYDSLTHESLVSWQRVRVANALATSGEEWVSYLDKLNSGTYNNQYMVLDLKRFTPGSELPAGLLWVAEQIPGLIASADLTEQLARGYFPSYNIPYFPQVYNQSGLQALRDSLAARGPEFSNSVAWLSYQLTPRATIFRRDAASVSTLDDMRRIMRSNSFRTDELSHGSPLAAVCARGDLDTALPDARGCFDTKVTSYELALELQADAITGPTTADGLPPFEWTKDFDSVPHVGMPKVFDFQFERQRPLSSVAVF